MDRSVLDIRWRDLASVLLGIVLAMVETWLAKPGVPPVSPPAVPPIVEPIPAPPAHPPAPPPALKPKVDAVQATARFSSGGTGCTCTILGPTPRAGYVAVLTANHCSGRLGRTFTVHLKDGRSYEAVTIAMDREADCALGVIKTMDVLPYAKIATSDPEAGVKVWQAGYGRGKSEKRYDGTVVSVGAAQTQMRIAFFSGDSGGGIFRDDNNELVSVVCCTEQIGAVTKSYGATVARIRAMLADAERRFTDDMGYTFLPEVSRD